MAYAYVHDVAATWTRYCEVTRGLVDPAPRGLIAHLAGRTDDGVRVIDVFDTEADGEAFRLLRLEPALAALGARARAHCVFRRLHPQDVVLCPSDQASA